MVRPGSGDEDVRHPATRIELGEENWQLVQRLADKRLVVASRNPAGEETVECEQYLDGDGCLTLAPAIPILDWKRRINSRQQLQNRPAPVRS